MFNKGVMQHDERDCGVAALATIFKINKLNISPIKIREGMRVGRSGVSIYALVEVASYYGITATALEGELEELIEEVTAGELKLPLIKR